MHPGETQYMQQLRAQLHALGLLFGSVPLQQPQQPNLDLDAILSEGLTNTELQGEVPVEGPIDTEKLYMLYMSVNAVPRFDLIPATLVNIYKTSLQGMTYQNVYCHSGMNKPRNPTCSEVLQLLPRLDEVLETSLSDKVNTLINTGKCNCHYASLLIIILTPYSGTIPVP